MRLRILAVSIFLSTILAVLVLPDVFAIHIAGHIDSPLQADLEDEVSADPNLLDNFATADTYFTQHPDAAALYPDKARTYLLSLGGSFGGQQRVVLERYLKQTAFGFEEDLQLAESYFVDGVSVSNLPQVFSSYLNLREGVVIQMPASVSGLDFVPPGHLLGKTGDVDLIALKEHFSFEVTSGGVIHLIDKSRTKHTFTGGLGIDERGRMQMQSGSIDSIAIENGKDITINQNTLAGSFTSVSGVVFDKKTAATFIKGSASAPPTLIPSKGAVIQSLAGLAGGVTIKGVGITLPPLQAGRSSGKLFQGSITYTNGKPSLIGVQSNVIVDGFQHTTKGRELYLGRRVEGKNYFLVEHQNGLPIIEADGRNFETHIMEDNPDFALPPRNLGLDSGDMGGKVLQSRLGVVLGLAGGKVQLRRTSQNDQPLQVYVRATGDFGIDSGNTQVKTVDRNDLSIFYQRPKNQDEIMFAVDMRIEHLRPAGVKTYDMNVDYTTTHVLTSAEQEALRTEVQELRTLKQLLSTPPSDPKLREDYNELAKDPQRLREAVSAVQERILERRAALERGYYTTLPVFGEVLDLSENAKVTSSNFFTSPNIHAKNVQFFGAGEGYDSAVLLIASRDLHQNLDFEASARSEGYRLLRAGELQKERYYVLVLQPSKIPESEYLKSGYDFLEVLKNPGLASIEPGLQIRTVSVHSHSWNEGASLTDEYRHDKEGRAMTALEIFLSESGKKRLFQKYIRGTDIRRLQFEELSDPEAQQIRLRFAKNGRIEFKGCNVNNFAPGSYQEEERFLSEVINEKTGIPVGGFPVKTDMTLYDPVQKRWVLNPHRAITETEIREGRYAERPSQRMLAAATTQSVFPNIARDSLVILLGSKTDPQQGRVLDVEYRTTQGETVRTSISMRGAEERLITILEGQYITQGFDPVRANEMATNELFGSMVSGAHGAQVQEDEEGIVVLN